VREIGNKKLNEEYLNDPRWETAEKSALKCRFQQANEVVNWIRKDYGLKIK